MDYERPVRSLREGAGISQAELARRMGYHQSRIVRLEQQGGRVELDTLLAVAEACGTGLSLEWSSGSLLLERGRWGAIQLVDAVALVRPLGGKIVAFSRGAPSDETCASHW